jgi:D-alanyl-D-alanine carboxypeptidase/D-alanyl-D-alanine-endopeptidase (penicillin-binding protein 4)
VVARTFLTVVLVLVVGNPGSAEAARARGAGAAAEEAPAPSEADPDRERILRLQQTLYSIVHGPALGRARIGIQVGEARSGRTLFVRGGDALMDPASNQKILASAAALLRLGNEYRFRTEVVGPPPDDDGVVGGSLTFRGSGDPSLGLEDVARNAEDLRARGITRVRGDVIADRTPIGAGEPVLQGKVPLQVSGQSLVIRIHPGDKPGARPSISVEPLEGEIQISNRAATRAAGRTRVRATLATRGGRIVLSVTGRIARRHPGVVLRKRPSASMLFAAALLRQALLDRRIVVEGGARVDEGHARTSPFPLFPLASHRSEPLIALLGRINKASNNDYADRLIETLGGEVYGGAPSMAKGIRALREALTDLGVREGSYVPTNGSGLGHNNRVSATGLFDLLRTLYFDPRIGPEILQSLSVGGVDGTTRNRFRGSPAAHHVRAKTGTLRGKSCLSGYVGEGNEILVFSILVDRIRRRSLPDVRKAQVRIVEALMSYVKGATGETPAEAVEPPTDFEVDEETIETEDVENGPPGEAQPAEGGDVESPGQG